MDRQLLALIAAGLALSSMVGGTAATAATPAALTASPSPSSGSAGAPTIVADASSSPGDVIPPVTTASGGGSHWCNETTTVRFAATDVGSGVAATLYQIDAGAWQAGGEAVVRAPRDHSNDGEHVISFYSVDNALNQEAFKTATVRIDTRPPRLVWKGVSPDVIRRVRSVSLRFTVNEYSGSARLAYEVTDQYGYRAASKAGLDRATGAGSIELMPRYRGHQGFVPGVYRVQVTARDEAGNSGVSPQRSFRVLRAVRGGVWRRIRGAGRRVALTFDDGDNAAWSSILRTLRRYRAHATFFPLGPYVAASPSLARRTVRAGNAIGVHGWTHSLMTGQSTGQIQREWMRATAPWWNATGYLPVPYCRPPYGTVSSATTAASAAIGFYRIILWDVDPRDWSRPGASVIASRVLSHVHPGAIVCMHLTRQTAQALPAILRGLKARRYRASSVAEMFHAAGMH